MRKLICTSLLMLAAGPALASDLDDVLTCNFETRGGYDNLKNVSSARLVGTMTMGPMQAPFSIEFKQPDKVRLEFEVQGMTAVQAYDGNVGWTIMPFLGKMTAEEMPADELKNIQEMAEFEGPLLDWEEKGHKVSLAGTEDIEGTEAYVINLERAGGDSSLMYLDTEYCLEFASKGKRDIQGNEMPFSTSIGDYKEVGNIVMPHSIVSTFGEGQGAPQQAITIETAELDVELSDDRFSMPEVPEPETAEAEE